MVMVSLGLLFQDRPEPPSSGFTGGHRGVLREICGFGGVVISDDLAAAAMEDLSPAERALKFVGAGGDLLIVGNPRLAPDDGGWAQQSCRGQQGVRRAGTTGASRMVSLDRAAGLPAALPKSGLLGDPQLRDQVPGRLGRALGVVSGIEA